MTSTDRRAAVALLHGKGFYQGGRRAAFRETVDLIEAAILAEREACAKEADELVVTAAKGIVAVALLGSELTGTDLTEAKAIKNVAMLVAVKIRDRSNA